MNVEEVQRRLCGKKGRLESSGKPDTWKLVRPVWGWGPGGQVPPAYTTRDMALASCTRYRIAVGEPAGREFIASRRRDGFGFAVDAEP